MLTFPRPWALVILAAALALLTGCKSGPEPAADPDPAEAQAQGAGSTEADEDEDEGEGEQGDEPAEASETKLEVKPPTCAPDDDMCRNEALGQIRMGWLTQGLSAEQVRTELGEPDSKSEMLEEGATGLYVQDWDYPDAGVHLHMAATTRDGELAVNGFTVRAPFAHRTPRGVGIGTPAEEVRAIYEGMISPLSREDLIIAGSVYGGAFFRIDEQGTVESIFVGAGAE